MLLVLEAALLLAASTCKGTLYLTIDTGSMSQAGRIAQILAIGQNHDAASLRRLVELRFNAIGSEEQLKDPSIQLSTFIS